MSKKFNQNYTYNPKKDLSSSEIAKGVLNVVVPAVGAAEVGKKIARKFKGDK